jgi:YggT family protein
MFVVQLLDLYSLVVLGAVVVSWLQLPPSNPIVTLLGTMTEPLLAPIRRILPDMSGLDFSPLVLLFGLRLLRGVLLTAALGQ